jgi:hypothetical protein
MILLTEKRLKFIDNMGMSRTFYPTVVGKSGKVECLLNSKKELAQDMERQALRSGADFATSTEVHCQWDDKGQFSEPPMFVAFEHDTKEIVSIHDQTALMLFVAGLAMESPNFKEELKLSKEDNIVFKSYWKTVDNMIDPGGVTHMTLDRFGYKFTIWRCFVNDSYLRKTFPVRFDPLEERFQNPTFER